MEDLASCPEQVVDALSRLCSENSKASARSSEAAAEFEKQRLEIDRLDGLVRRLSADVDEKNRVSML